ncbi:MAG: hypothetical protein BroJett040_23890 [Oligoflexia bacterium]|nr:MAG: hypothetical protein BroJett040_23890 [Oligoflexia bacterium]
MKTNTIKSQKGFSLVELMVVVAILGILATMAVPQVTKFMAKARQSEAKSNLAAIYTANKAFFTEYNGYHVMFEVIGYAPEGQMRYNTGFGGAAAAISGYSGPAGTYNSSVGYCGASNGKCTVLAEGQSDLAGAMDSGWVATNTTFTAGARSSLLKDPNKVDVWTINENKMVKQDLNGID